MNARDYLKKIKHNALKIRALQDQLEELKAGQVYMDAITYDKERVQSSGSMESKYILQSQKIISLQQDITKLIEEYHAEKQYIVEQINELGDELYAEILYKRYVLYKSMADIANDMGYSESYINHCHLDALKLFEAKYFGD